MVHTRERTTATRTHDGQQLAGPHAAADAIHTKESFRASSLEGLRARGPPLVRGEFSPAKWHGAEQLITFCPARTGVGLQALVEQGLGLIRKAFCESKKSL